MAESHDNYVEMSDEEFLKQAPPTIEEETDNDPGPGDEADAGNTDAPDGGDAAGDNDGSDPATDTDADDSGDADEQSGADDSGDQDEDGDAGETEQDASADNTDADKGEDAQKVEKVDFESEYKKLLAPFQANGKQIQVENTDEAIRLMQYGANYHKKMASLKPALKIVKLLDHAGLMDESKINYLIDLHTKNPAAITQLLKDAQIDPMSVDMEADSKYTPQTRTVSDKELQLDEVLESIQHTETYSRTLNVLTKEWDESSQKIIVDTPNLISVINGHMATGDFDQVTSLVARERALGNLQGLSDIDAYYAVGEKLAKQGHLKSQQSQEPTKSSLQSPPEKPGLTQDEVRKKKQAAAASRTKPTGQKSSDVPNILAMSDEDFAKLSSPPYKQL